MFSTYVWQVSNIDPQVADSRFTQCLKSRRDLCQRGWGSSPTLEIHKNKSILIGQIRYETGVKEWKSHVRRGGNHILWGGICENYLGCKYTPSEVKVIQTILHETPNKLCLWDGRYCVVSWRHDSGKVLITTGATESPTLWYADGPNGWAVGSNASVILDLVGHRKTPGVKDLRLFLAHGYLISNGSLFRHTYRLSSRKQVILCGSNSPRISSYASIFDCLYRDQPIKNRSEAIQITAERILERVSRQLNYSEDPVVFLTGGRDSRCIAAAAKRSDFQPVVYTSGNAVSPDCRIASKVANRLQLQHEQSLYHGSPIEPLLGAPEYVNLWLQLSEGIETLRHALPFQSFFTRKSFSPPKPRPVFHGLCGGLGKGFYYLKGGMPTKHLDETDISWARKSIISTGIGNQRRLWGTEKNLARDWLEEVFDHFDADLGFEATIAQWLDIFYWQNKCLHWGEDMMSVKEPMGWRWTPLMDRLQIQAILSRSAEDKMTSRFLEDVTLTIAPELEGLAYDKVLRPTKKRARKAIKKLLAQMGVYQGLRPLDPRNVQPYDNSLIKFWNKVFFGQEGRIWNELIDERFIRELIQKNPSSEILWNSATVALFLRANLG